MRFFPLLDFQYVVLFLFFGFTLLIALYLAFNPEMRDLDPEIKGEHAEDIGGRNNPVPLFLILFYIGFLIWSIAYVVLIGIRGKPF